MLPYIVLYSMIVLLPALRIFFKNKQNYKNVYTAVIFMTLLFILGLRHPTMGNDLPGYLESYRDLYTYSWDKIFSLESYLNYEKGYIIFNKLIAQLTGCDEQLFLFICAALSLVCVWVAIFKRSEDITLSTVIYLGLPIFLLLFSGIRQSIAIGICCLSLGCVERKKFLPFILMVLLACCFHYTAIIFVLAFLLYHLKISEKLRWILLVLFPVVFLLRGRIFLVLALIFKDTAQLQQTSAITMMLVFAMIYIFCMVLCHEKYDQRTNGYMNIFFFAALCLIFSGVHTIAIRMGYYFMPGLMFALPLALQKVKDWRWRVLIKIGVAVCFIWFGIDCLVDTYWAKAYPYFAFWQEVIL